MASLLRQLYEDPVSLCETAVPTDPVYRTKGRELGERRKAFEERLDPEMLVTYEALRNLDLEVTSMELYANFVCGFRAGVRLMVEGLGEGDSV